MNNLMRLQVRGPLDVPAVDHIRRLLDRLDAPGSGMMILCDDLTRLDPVAVAALWTLCVQTERRGLRIQIDGLSERHLRRLRAHPILRFAPSAEDIFEDPFASRQASAR